MELLTIVVFVVGVGIWWNIDNLVGAVNRTARALEETNRLKKEGG